MSIEIIAYSCSFKCRCSPRATRKAMENHEKNCFLNPSRRACKACEHWCKDDYKNGFCSIEALPAGKTITHDCEKFTPSNQAKGTV